MKKWPIEHPMIGTNGQHDGGGARAVDFLDDLHNPARIILEATLIRDSYSGPLSEGSDASDAP